MAKIEDAVNAFNATAATFEDAVNAFNATAATFVEMITNAARAINRAFSECLKVNRKVKRARHSGNTMKCHWYILQHNRRKKQFKLTLELDPKGLLTPGQNKND